jgi:fatty-acyl-CoA synthase
MASIKGNATNVTAHTDEPVYRWTERGRPVYRRMTAEDTRAYDAEFARHSRER